jgi:hypothetical protein
MQHLILLAIVSMLVFYVLIIRRLFMLCWAARASGLLITLLLLNDRGRFAHGNGGEHSLKSPACSCVSIKTMR